VIQIQKKAAGLASKAEARRREAWAAGDKNQVVSLLRSKKHPKIVRLLLAGARGFSPLL